MIMFLLAFASYCIGFYIGRKSVVDDIATHCSCCKELE